MRDSERGYTEILVHTSAPSRGQDDIQYRALAQAYLDFEPASHHTVLDRWRGIQDEDELEVLIEPESQASYRPDDEPEAVPSSVASSQNTHINQLSQLQAIDSIDLSFNSVLDNADSPVFRERLGTRLDLPKGTQTEAELDHSTDSWQPPPSTIADSQPENNAAAAAYLSPSRVLDLYLRQMENSKIPTSGTPLVSPEEHSTELPDTNIQAESSMEINGTERTILSCRLPLSTPHGTTEAHSRVLRNRQQGISQSQEDTLKRKYYELSSDPIQVSSSAPETRSLKPHLDVSSNTAITKMVEQVKVSSPQAIMTSTEITTSTPAPTQSSSVSNSFRASYISVLEIRPPPPVISMSNLIPEMLRTASLDQLARKMPLHILYRPQHQNRALRDTERGHWLITCKTWKEELRIRSWDFLGNFISKGQAGWGVWCVREEDFGTIRVYCWGAVVGYIYLLLYMASERKIKGTGASWVGGDGQAIITMPC